MGIITEEEDCLSRLSGREIVIGTFEGYTFLAERMGVRWRVMRRIPPLPPPSREGHVIIKYGGLAIKRFRRGHLLPESLSLLECPPRSEKITEYLNARRLTRP